MIFKIIIISLLGALAGRVIGPIPALLICMFFIVLDYMFPTKSNKNNADMLIKNSLDLSNATRELQIAMETEANFLKESIEKLAPGVKLDRGYIALDNIDGFQKGLVYRFKKEGDSFLYMANQKTYSKEYLDKNFNLLIINQ